MALFVYILLCLIWGSTWLAIKLGLTGTPPFYGASIRFVIAVTLLTVISRVMKARFPVGMRNWLRLGHPGLYMYGVSYACVYYGETQINSSLTAILFGSFPLFVALLSSRFLKQEPIRPIAWLGLFLGFGGVVLISYDSLQVSPEMFFGSVVVLVGSLASAVGLMVHQRTCGTANIYTAATVQMGVGGLALIVMALLTESISDVHLTRTVIGATLYLAMFGSVVAFLGYYWLLKRMSAVAVALMTFVTPLVAILLGVCLYHESLSTLVLIGGACIMGSVALVVRKK
jgi:drug/metabolite transporter (DMT)-like permease